MALLAESASYVFRGDPPSSYLQRYRRLGQFIIEGSKPGAAAAAVYVVHKVLPLDHRHFGRLPAATIKAAEAFHARALRFAAEQRERLHVLVPFVPDSNLVCLALNPRGNASVAAANAFVDRLYARLRTDIHVPVQDKEFFGSVTTLQPALLGSAETRRIFGDLGLACSDTGEPLTILRHTLMNPYLLDRTNDISYIDRYFEFLARCMDDLMLAAPDRSAVSHRA